MTVSEAVWVEVKIPNKDQHFVELAGGYQGKFKWQVLLASNGKLYRRFATSLLGSGDNQDVKWEGYEA